MHGQCDCACGIALSTYPKTIDVNTTSQFYLNPDLQEAYLIDGYTVLFIPSGQEIVVINSLTHQILEYFNTPHAITDIPIDWQYLWGERVSIVLQSLVDLKFLIQTDTPIMDAKVFSAGDVLTAWLEITNTCNLHCSYCYIKKTNSWMSKTVGENAIDAIFRSAEMHNFSKIKFKFSGGEPTLNLPLILSLQDRARRLSYLFKKELVSIVLTNGINLSQRYCQLLLEHNLKLSISLDGISNIHDRQRSFSNGKGSYNLVKRSIDIAVSEGLVPHISITLTDLNLESLADTVLEVSNLGLPFSINFYRENQNSHSADQDFHINDDERIISNLLKALKIIEEAPPKWSALGTVSDRLNLAFPHEYPCGVGQNYLVINTDGYISKCHMQMDYKVTTVYDEDPLNVLQKDRIGLQNISVNDKEFCRDCIWRYWCSGGCPWTTVNVYGCYNTKSPYCSIYQTILLELIRLEGLRMLKWESSRI